MLDIPGQHQNKLDIASQLHGGNNTVSIEVAGPDRIRHMHRNNTSWKNHHEINFVHIQYNPFHASGWPVMLSDIAGQVYVKEIKIKE